MSMTMTISTPMPTPRPTSTTMTRQPGIVHDGCTIRFMRPSERELWRRRALPAEWVVIVPPSETGVTMAPEEVSHDDNYATPRAHADGA